MLDARTRMCALYSDTWKVEEMQMGRVVAETCSRSSPIAGLLLVSHRRAPSRLPSPSLPPPRHPAIVPRPSSLVPGRRRSSRDVPQMVPTAIPYPRHPRRAAQSIHTVVRPRQLHTLRRQWAACRRKWPACSVPKRHVGIHVGFPFRLSRSISLVASPSRMHHDTIPLSALRQRSQSPRGGVKRKPRASQRRRRAPT